MVDWARRVRTRADESTTQAESLAAEVSRTRAMSEVTASVAREAQTGFSGSTSTASQSQYGETTGEAWAGVKLPGVVGAIGQALFGGGGNQLTAGSRGTSFATSTATTNASGWASSSGERTLNSEMLQNIADRTHQAANSVRNRRATTVTEVSQEESEKLSTRVVTNYNHMHALTIQYFEVVQIYRVVLELSRKTRCLFLPMRLVTFNNETIKRFRNVIAAAGLTPEVRALAWLQPNQILLVAPSRAGQWNVAKLKMAAQAIGDKLGAPDDAGLVLPSAGLKIRGVGGLGVAELFSELIVELRDGSVHRYSIPAPSPDDSWGFLGPLFPSGRELWEREGDDFRRFTLVRRPGKESESGVLEVNLAFNVEFPNGSWAADRVNVPSLAVSVPIRYNKDQTETVAFELGASIAQADVIDHLKQNALHYSSAIWRSLDAATITTMLSAYTFNGRPLIEQVDPVPVTVIGNYLVFRTYADEKDESWQRFLEKHDLVNPKPLEDMVPLPSGGVFAEAVLGRSNSAEKLDITRFWNWQDSPIPILPPEINPLTAGGKAADPNVRTAPLEGHVLNIVNPPSLPDPAGLAPLYSAIANGNMFRDMSGLAQIATLAQSALQAAQAGAAGATTAAGQAQQVAASQLTEFMKLIAQVAMTALGGGAGGVLGGIGGAVGGASSTANLPSTPTNLGAKINAAKDLDQRESRLGSVVDPASEWMPWPGLSSEPSFSPPPLVTTDNERAAIYGDKPAPKTRVTKPKPLPVQLFVEGRVVRDGRITQEPVTGRLSLLLSRVTHTDSQEIPTEVIFDLEQGVGGNMVSLVREQNYLLRPTLLLSKDAIANWLDQALAAIRFEVPGLDLKTLTSFREILSDPKPIKGTGGTFAVPSGAQSLIFELLANIETYQGFTSEIKLDGDIGFKGSYGATAEFDSSKISDFAMAILKALTESQAILAGVGAILTTFTLKLQSDSQHTISGGVTVGSKLVFKPQMLTSIHLQPKVGQR